MRIYTIITIVATLKNGLRKRATVEYERGEAVEFLDASSIHSGKELLQALDLLEGMEMTSPEYQTETELRTGIARIEEIERLSDLKRLELQSETTESVGDTTYHSRKVIVENSDYQEKSRSEWEKDYSFSKSNADAAFPSSDYGGYEGHLQKITGYKGADESIVIPGYVGNAMIVEIGQRAFAGNTTLCSVSVPEGVVKIGANAFANCLNLKSVILPNSILEIGPKAFAGCPQMETPTIPANAIIANDAFSGESKAAAKAFASKNDPSTADDLEEYKKMFKLRINKSEIVILDATPKTKELVFPETMAGLPVRMDTDGIRDNPYIEKVYWPAKYDAGVYAFANCKNLKEVIIPETVSHFSGFELSDTPFWRSFSGLVVINHVALGNNGCDRKIVIPPDVYTIAPNFLGRSPMLREIVLPSSVTHIEPGAFSKYSVERSRTLNVYIPKGHFQMSGLAGLKDCPENTTIYAPAGTKTEQFAKKRGIRFVAAQGGMI